MFLIATFAGMVIGFLLGISFPSLSLIKVSFSFYFLLLQQVFWCDFGKYVFIFLQMNFPSSILPMVNTIYVEVEKQEISSRKSPSKGPKSSDASSHKVCFVSSL